MCIVVTGVTLQDGRGGSDEGKGGEMRGYNYSDDAVRGRVAYMTYQPMFILRQSQTYLRTNRVITCHLISVQFAI